MRIDLTNIDRIVKANNLKEITDPIFLDFKKEPTTNGLFSYEIFGRNPVERRTTFAYIDLKKRYLHPALYKMFKTMMRDILKCISGEESYIIKHDGSLVKDKNGEKGITFLYDNWEKIKFRYSPRGDDDENVSVIRKSYVDLLRSMKKDDIFVDKWIVIPAFYRDVNLMDVSNGRIAVDEINYSYQRLISSTRNTMNEFLGLEMFSYRSDSIIQQTLNEIYDFFIDKLRQKKGIIKDKLLKKVVDFSSRGVIHVNKQRYERYSDNPVNYEYSGIPMSHLISLYFPLIRTELVSLFDIVLETHRTDKTQYEKMEKYIHKNYTPKKIESILKRLVTDNSLRLSKVKLYEESKNKFYYLNRPKPKYKKPVKYNEHEGKTFDITWIELIFELMTSIVTDKFVIITRYPMDNFQNLFITRSSVLTTTETVPAGYKELFYKNYPAIPRDKDGNIKTKYVDMVDAITFASAYLDAINGDFDGDTVSLRSLYSQEANLEAKQIMYKKISMLNMEGGTIRTMKNDGYLGLYSLTK